MEKRTPQDNKSDARQLVRRSALIRCLQTGIRAIALLLLAPAHQALAQAPDARQPVPVVQTGIPAVPACPSLAGFYPGTTTDWQAMHQQLSPLMPRCLRSAEYFALLGAALLNIDQLADALEALERALLLDPGNGGAQIDYAEALFRQGQLFSALELNQQILARDDVPEFLNPMLQQRQDNWRNLTR